MIDMKKLTILLTLAALGVLVVSAVPVRAASQLNTPPPEQIWKFFVALPGAGLPADIDTRAEREAFNKEYHEHLAEVAELQNQEDGEEFFYGDYLEEIDYQLFWNPTILDPDWMQDVAEDLTEENGPMQSIEFDVFPGSDPDKIFGMLEVREFDYSESKILGLYCYWYSISQDKATTVSLPLDVPYTDDDITDDGLLLYNQNELYWAMRDRKLTWLAERDRIILILEGIGLTPVCYNWNGTKFLRDRSYSPMSVYSGGVGPIHFNESIPFNVHGYETEWMDTEEDNVRAWKYVKEGESEPRLIVYAYGNSYSSATVDAIDILTPLYRLYEKIYVGMPASEAMECIKEIGEDTYGETNPYVSAFDGKAWIFSGHEDPFQLGVDLKYYKNGKLTPDARISLIRIAPAVG
jgi:hypothetical protein